MARSGLCSLIQKALDFGTPDIRHVQRMCESIYPLKSADLHKLGAPREVWQAIAAAHALQPPPKPAIRSKAPIASHPAQP